MLKKVVLFAVVFMLVLAAVPPVVSADWKGIFHPHTDWSDGELTFEELDKRVKNAGAQFVVVNDHIDWTGLGIDNPEKEINLRKVLRPNCVGVAKYIAKCQKMSEATSRVYIPSIEYTWPRRHLGVVPITVDLHQKIMGVFAKSLAGKKGLQRDAAEDAEVRQVLQIVREYGSIPWICHPTLRMSHPQKGSKQYSVTDYTFSANLWINEPIKLVECMNYGNLDGTADLVPLIMAAEKAAPGSVVLVAGNDFHTDSAEKLGIWGNRILGMPREFPSAFKRFTWIKTERTDLSAAAVIEELHKGDTYLTYGGFTLDPVGFENGNRHYNPYCLEAEPIGDSELVAADVSIYFGKKLTGNWDYQLYRDGSNRPISNGSLKGQCDYYYVEKDVERLHRYLLVIPGGAIVGPFNRRPLTVAEKKEIKDEKVLNNLYGALGTLGELLQFRIELIPSVQKLPDGDAVTVPVRTDKVDRSRHSHFYLYVDVYNPEKGDVVEISNNRNNTVQRITIPDKLADSHKVRVPLVMLLKTWQSGQVVYTVKVRDVVEKVKISIVDDNRAAVEWNRVLVSGVSFDVPKSWCKDEGVARDPSQGYCGNDPRGQTVELQVMPRRYDSITRSSVRDFFPGMADDRQKARLINTEFTQARRLVKLVIDWQEGDGQYRRVVVVKLRGNNQAWLVDIYSTRPYDLFQKAFFDRITESLNPAN